MCTKILNIAVITNVIPSYREGFYDRLFKREDVNVTVYCQDQIPGMNLKTIHDKYSDRVKLVKFIAASKEKIAWQFLPWCKITTNYDVVFVGGNPRTLSDVVISCLLHFMGKSIVFWTMAHSFRARALTEKIRLFWSRLFNFIFVYTDSEVDFLKSVGFKNNFILGMNNGLDQIVIDEVRFKWTKASLHEWRYSNQLNNSLMILSCARLEAKNKFEQVIQALPLLLKVIPNIVWCVIGEGEMKDELEMLVKNAGLENNVRFIGAIYEENLLAPWFLSSEILIHPAAIGLTLLHSFGYSLPVVTHGEAKLHGPEYAAFEPELTGRNFHIDNIQSLAETISGLLFDEKSLFCMKNYSHKVAQKKYNVDVMVERFVTIARKAYKK